MSWESPTNVHNLRKVEMNDNKFMALVKVVDQNTPQT